MVRGREYTAGNGRESGKGVFANGWEWWGPFVLIGFLFSSCEPLPPSPKKDTVFTRVPTVRVWVKEKGGKVGDFVVIQESFISLWMKKARLLSLLFSYWSLKEHSYSSLG